MLIENDLMGRNISQSISGIGINVNQEVFHSTAPNPISLRQITGKQYDIFEILKISCSAFNPVMNCSGTVTLNS